MGAADRRWETRASLGVELSLGGTGASLFITGARDVDAARRTCHDPDAEQVTLDELCRLGAMDRPPSFLLFSNLKEIPDHYLRYLINGMRERFDMPGVPIRLAVKKNKNPYAETGDDERG